MTRPKLPEPADIAKRTEAAAIEKFQGPVDGITSPCGTWIKVKASYDDKWRTPMAGAKFNLYLNSEQILEGKHLKDFEQVGLVSGEAPPKDPAEAKQWHLKYAELGTFYYPTCDQGQAYFEIVSDPSVDSQIKELDDAIEATLDGAYRNLETSMSGFRQEWEVLGSEALLTSIGAGALEGTKSISTGIAETAKDSYDWMSDGDSWVQLWDDIGNIALEGTDWAQESAQQAWYLAKNTSTADIIKAAEEASKSAKAIGNAAIESIDQAIENAGANVEYVKKIVKHRKAVLNFPNLIINTDVNGIENFIDITLADIDPDWAIQLKYDKSWQNTLELVNYRTSVTTYIAYVQQFFEVVPPNFYTFYFGKGGIYIFYEVILFVIGVLLGGIGAAARASVIMARLANMTNK